jgi:hypothetical protein
MPEPFIEVSSKTTKAKQMVPAHYLGHPVLGKDFEPTAAGKEQLRLNAGPTDDWTLKQLQEYAGAAADGLTTKKDVLAAIADSEQSPHVGDPHLGSTGPGVPPDAENPDTSTTDNPDAGDKE